VVPTNRRRVEEALEQHVRCGGRIAWRSTNTLVEPQATLFTGHVLRGGYKTCCACHSCLALGHEILMYAYVHSGLLFPSLGLAPAMQAPSYSKSFLTTLSRLGDPCSIRTCQILRYSGICREPTFTGSLLLRSGDEILILYLEETDSATTLHFAPTIRKSPILVLQLNSCIVIGLVEVIRLTRDGDLAYSCLRNSKCRIKLGVPITAA
jgi:hypothetical protein